MKILLTDEGRMPMQEEVKFDKILFINEAEKDILVKLIDEATQEKT